jgi:hypothetical protein
MLNGALGELGAGQEDAITAQDVERDEASKGFRCLAIEGGSDRVVDVRAAFGASRKGGEGAKLFDIGLIAAQGSRIPGDW